MNNKQQSRKDKIQLLKKIIEGKATIKELLPKTFCSWYYVDGIYKTSGKTGRLSLTKNEFEQYTKKRPNQTNIVVKYY